MVVRTPQPAPLTPPESHPTPMPTYPPPLRTSFPRLAAWGIAALAWATLAAWLSSLGESHHPLLGLAVVLERLGQGGAAAAAYLAAAVGWGLAFLPSMRSARHPRPLAIALGLAFMFTLTHLLGIAGMLRTAPVAWLPVLLGLILLVWRRRELADPTPGNETLEPAARGMLACAAVALAVILIAAANPPGWLWDSEFGGYDALEYHLQLPNEWRRMGRVWPLEHNVYSFLPGYAEAAFLHVGLLFKSLPYSAQFLHVGLALLAAWLIARAARAAGALRTGAIAAAVLVLTLPWTAVVASMPYNEMGVLAMFAGAFIAASERDLSPSRRGIIVGLLVGVACGFKPSAIVLAAPAAAIIMARASNPRQWFALFAWASLAGLAALAPWLLRNFLASANPVFPYLSSLFGPAHWTPEQFERFARGHRFAGSMVDRLALLVLPDRHDPASPGRPVHRGLLHPQWSIFFPIVLACLGALGVLRATRRAGATLAAALAAQIAAWLLFTHVQARFLLPAAVIGAVAAGLACRGRSAWAFLAATALLTASTLWRFAHERDGRPNAALLGGTDLFDGQIVRDEWARASPARRAELAPLLTPEACLNLTLGDQGVYLLGDATPYYLRVRVIYHTTWDTSPLGRLMRDHPGDPAQWTRRLRNMGADYVLWNTREVDRLHRSGWYDPLVTNHAILDWLDRHAAPVQAWPDSGRYLFRLLDPDTTPDADSPP